MSRTNPTINHVFWILNLSRDLQNSNRIMIFPLNVSSKHIDYIGKKNVVKMPVLETLILWELGFREINKVKNGNREKECVSGKAMT